MNHFILQVADYIVLHDATLREAASVFSVSKSFLHRRLNKDLKNIDPILYTRIKAIFLDHTKTRHLHGGMATKLKYVGR